MDEEAGLTVLMILTFLAIVLFYGSPDLHDALINYVNTHAECYR